MCVCLYDFMYGWISLCLSVSLSPLIATLCTDSGENDDDNSVVVVVVVVIAVIAGVVVVTALYFIVSLPLPSYSSFLPSSCFLLVLSYSHTFVLRLDCLFFSSSSLHTHRHIGSDSSESCAVGCSVVARKLLRTSAVAAARPCYA